MLNDQILVAAGNSKNLVPVTAGKGADARVGGVNQAGFGQEFRGIEGHFATLM